MWTAVQYSLKVTTRLSVKTRLSSIPVADVTTVLRSFTISTQLRNNTVTIFQGGVIFDPTGIVDQSVVNGVKKKYRVGINVRGAATYIAKNKARCPIKLWKSGPRYLKSGISHK